MRALGPLLVAGSLLAAAAVLALAPPEAAATDAPAWRFAAGGAPAGSPFAGASPTPDGRGFTAWASLPAAARVEALDVLRLTAGGAPLVLALAGDAPPPGHARLDVELRDAAGALRGALRLAGGPTEARVAVAADETLSVGLLVELAEGAEGAWQGRIDVAPLRP